MLMSNLSYIKMKMLRIYDISVAVHGQVKGLRYKMYVGARNSRFLCYVQINFFVVIYETTEVPVY